MHSLTQVLVSVLLLGTAQAAAQSDTPTATPRYEIVQPERATTPASRILLRDLVDDAAEAKLPGEILDLDLGRAPTPGFGRQIDRRFLEALAPEVAFRGASVTTLYADQVTIEQSELTKIARQKLDESLAGATIDTIDVVRAPLSVSVPRGRDSRNLVARIRGIAQAKGPVTVQVDIEVDGSLARTAQVVFDLRSRETIHVLAADVARGAVLTEKDVKTVEVDASGRTGSSSDPTLLIGLVAKRELRAGTLLKSGDFEPQIVIQRGDAVRIRFSHGGLTLETRGIAKESGALGDRIRIDNLETKKPLTGRVAGTGLVAVDP